MRHVAPWWGFAGWDSYRRGRQRLYEEYRSVQRAVGSLAFWAEDHVSAHLGRTGLVLAGTALALGVLFVAQLQSVPRKTTTALESRQEVAAATVHRLEADQAELKKLIGDLRAGVASQQQAAATEKTTLAEINQELERQKILAGMVPLRGRGVKVLLDDSAATKIPAGDDPSLYIIHEYQLRDVLNLLWVSGAEAVSLNGERIVATTSIYCVGSTILVNDTRLSPPYEFLAIGDSAALESALSDSANLQALKARVKAYGVQLTTSRQSQAQVPAYTGSLAVKHAVPAGKTDARQPEQTRSVSDAN